MGMYRYEAIDKVGKVVRGVMSASDEQQVAQKLGQMGYSVRGVYGAGAQPAPAQVPTAATASAPAQRATGMQRVTLPSGVPVSIRPKVPADRLAMFFRQLVTLVQAGIPLYQSFGDMARTSDVRLRRVVPEIQQALQAGQSLSSALGAYPDLFPAHTIASVWCGELSGKLDVILGEVASDLEAEASDARLGRIGWGIVRAYTIFLVLTWPLFTLLGNMTSQVLGDDPASAASSDGIMGSAMRDIVWMIVHVCVPIAVGLVLTWVIWAHVKRVPAVRAALDSALLRVPVWGRIHRFRSVSRFLHVLDLLYGAGINPSQAWDAASFTPRNSDIIGSLRSARKAASVSTGIAELAAMSSVLEPEEVSLIASGEKTGQVPDSLARISSTYEEKARLQKSTARILSIGLMNSSLIAITGIGLIVLAKTYVAPIARFIGIQ